ncbi:hypothetical protein B0T13DRAFT_527795 [Neurospora crassa]|nr:hypothetical protein B0T13DRAFT_527795 [Neurospora crassa]
MHYNHHGIHQCYPANSMDKFTNFQRLPAELRNIIWEFSLPEPRVYEILDAPNSKRKTPPHEGLMFANIHPEPPPALAAVCHESRSFVLHHYKPLTLGRTTKYIDLSRDVLLLEPYLLIKRLHRTLHFMSQISFLRDNINRLALGTSYGIYTGIYHPVLSWKVSKTNMGKLLTNLAKFPRLKVLIFIVHQEFQFEFDFRFPGTLTSIPNYPLQHSVSTTLQPLFTSVPSATGFPYPISSVSSSVILPSRSSSSNPIPTLAEPASNGLHFYSTVSNSSSSSSNKNTIATPGNRYKLPYSSPLLFPSLPSLPPPYPNPQDSHLPLPLPPFPLLLQQQHQHQHQQPQPSQSQRPQLVHQAYRFKFDIEANINHAPRRPHLNELLYYPLDVDKEDDGDGENFDYYNFSEGGGGRSSNGNGNSEWTNNDHNDDDDEDVRGDVNRVGGGRGGGRGGGGRGGGSGGEWSDPWPTNDDWRRFRQRFQKAVRQSLEVMERHRLACLAAAEAAKVADGGEKHSAKGGKESNASGRRKKTGKGTTTTTTKAAEKNSWSGRASREAEWEWERQWEREREPWRAGLEGRTGKHATRIRVPAIKGASLLWRYTRGGQFRGIRERRPRAWKQVCRGKKTQLDCVVVTMILVVITALDIN